MSDLLKIKDFEKFFETKGHTSADDVRKALDKLMEKQTPPKKAELPPGIKRYANTGGSEHRNLGQIDATIVCMNLCLGSCPTYNGSQKWFEELTKEGIQFIVSVLDPSDDYNPGRPGQIPLSSNEKGGKLEFGSIKVRTAEIKRVEMSPTEDTDPYFIEIRKIEVVPKKGETHRMVHILLYMPDHEAVPINVFDVYVDCLSKFINKNTKALFHCSAGKGRSPTCLAGLLLKISGGDLYEIVFTIRMRRMFDCINGEQLKCLWEYSFRQ